MPICRSALSPVPLHEHRPVRLSRYVVTRRISLRAANDNQRPRVGTVWHWAVAVGAVPMLAMVALLTRLF